MVIVARRSALKLAVVALVLVALMSPALWNGYPLLQYDTGGYLARFYEGYLVPSRSTVFGLYLHLGETSHFWFNVVAQSLIAIWILRVTLRSLGIDGWRRSAGIVIALSVTTALPFLASLLLTDIFAGLAVLAVWLLVFCDGFTTRAEKIALFALLAFAGATHTATFAVILGLCAAGWFVWPFLRTRLDIAGLAIASGSLVMAAALLLTANYALSKQVAWTPGGYGILFGRMLQDGIVKRYLDDNCSVTAFKLCPHRAELPATADEFLWANSVFNRLGRFAGLNDEMRAIVLGSLRDYPATQARSALDATAQQLLMVKTGEGTHDKLWHTYGIIERFIPGEVAAMRAAHQQRGLLDFEAVNAVHSPIAFLSLAAMIAVVGHALWRRRLDDHALLAATILTAYLGNAFVLGAISGPHDRYGARIVWIATFAALAILLRRAGRMAAHRPFDTSMAAATESR